MHPKCRTRCQVTCAVVCITFLLLSGISDTISATKPRLATDPCPDGFSCATFPRAAAPTLPLAPLSVNYTQYYKSELRLDWCQFVNTHLDKLRGCIFWFQFQFQSTPPLHNRAPDSSESGYVSLCRKSWNRRRRETTLSTLHPLGT